MNLVNRTHTAPPPIFLLRALLLTLALTAVAGVTAFSASDSKPVEAQQTPADFWVSNLDNATALRCEVGVVATNRQCAQAFTTGNRSGGYILNSISAGFLPKFLSPGNITVAIHQSNGGVPADKAKAELSGSSNPGASSNYTYTCSTNCELFPGTTYFVVMSTQDTGGNLRWYKWRESSSTGETKHPPDNGWSIGDGSHYRDAGSNWQRRGPNSPPLALRVDASANTQAPSRPAAPSKPTLTAGVGSITVNWNEPADNGNAAITGYDVQYCWWTWEDVDYCKNVANWRNWPHRGTATTATLSVLYGSATHLVKVRAVNSEGAGEWSAYNWIKPLVGKLAAPGNLRVTAMEHENGDWLKADWDWPNWSGSRVHEWQLRYRYCKVCDSNSPDWSVWEHQYDEGDGFSDGSIYNVAAGVTYQVQVRGRNDASWGDWSDPGEATTRTKAQGARGQTVAPPPSDVQFERVTVSGTSVRIYGSGSDTWWYDYRSSSTGDWYGCTAVKGFGPSGVHTVTISTPGEYRFEISAPDCGRGGDYFAAQYLTIAAPPPPVGQSTQPTPTPADDDDDDGYYSCSYPVDLPGHPCHGIYVP